MTRAFTCGLAAALALTLPAEPATKTEKCPVCRGAGALSLKPPDYGQHAGEMNEANSKRWNVAVKPCPICGGKRRVTRYVVDHAPQEGETACSTCQWAGVVVCRKCRGEGLVKCQARRRGATRSVKHKNKVTVGDIRCDEGWNVTEYGDNEKHLKKRVEPCPECRGVGRVKCAECDGMGAVVCTRCAGTGHKERK